MSGPGCAFSHVACTQEIIQGSKYCEYHKCGVEGCMHQRTWVGGVCIVHTCWFRAEHGYTECHLRIEPNDGFHCTHHKHGGMWYQAGECRCDVCVHPTKSAHKT
jgi:hypothetical protein